MSMLCARPPDANRKKIEYRMNNTEDPFKFATDNLFTEQEGFGVGIDIFFCEKIIRVLKKLFEAGIIQLNLEDYMTEMYREKISGIHVKQEEYSTLTWDQLYPGFYIWLVALFVCIIVFLGELIVFRIQSVSINRKIIVVQSRALVV